MGVDRDILVTLTFTMTSIGIVRVGLQYPGEEYTVLVPTR